MLNGAGASSELAVGVLAGAGTSYSLALCMLVGAGILSDDGVVILSELTPLSVDGAGLLFRGSGSICSSSLFSCTGPVSGMEEDV